MPAVQAVVWMSPHSDKQRVVMARQYFLKYDRMNSTAPQPL